MGIEQVNCAKILGLTISWYIFTYTASQHHTNAMQSTPLPPLSAQISGQALNTVFNALILSKIYYAVPAFSGHISTADKNRINKFFRKAHRKKLVSQSIRPHSVLLFHLFL